MLLSSNKIKKVDKMPCEHICSGWQSDRVIYLLDESGDVEAGERCLLSRFEDNSVSTCKCRAQLPCCHHQREVPLCIRHTHMPEKDIMHLTDTLGGHKSSSISHRS